MTPQEFIAKWQQVTLTERSACQQHFLDLCELLGQPKPAEADPEGAWYTFERGVSKTGGGNGWADVWMRGHFGWEYKGKHRDLVAAYRQLLLYREDLENPPLLVVCDMDRFEVHTNFTGTAKQVHAFDLNSLAEPKHLDVLRRLFTEPQSLRPGQTTEKITEEVAERFAALADGMRSRGVPAPEAAHFLMKLMFCLFSEDIGLLPKKLFMRVVEQARKQPDKFAARLKSLFEAMSTGGPFGADDILWFNGGLFADSGVIELTEKEIAELRLVCEFEWSQVEPSIFGTLFERTLDPTKRSQIGAHYTSRADIETLLEPVMMAPLRRQWAAVQEQCEAQWAKVAAGARKAAGGKGVQRKPSKPMVALENTLRDFVEQLSHVTVLDPACGSGNFLYVAIGLLLDLEKEVITYAATRGVSLLPQVRPTQLAGIEINPYAQQLAQVVIWIGYLQWMQENGFPAPRDPVLEPIESIRCMDAIIDLSDPAHPREPEWPAADYIVGNPPFLGGKLLRANLGDEYVNALFHVWNDRVPREGDLCCYWFERARSSIQRGRAKRAGLLATQGIRGGANRKVVERIKDSGGIFFAESDRPWILDGANVHVSMIGFDDGSETIRTLDGYLVTRVNANLSGMADIAAARRLQVNAGISFMGDTKGGGFDIDDGTALDFLKRPNPHGRPNSDVIIPWVNGLDLTRRSRGMWIIDFGVERTEAEAALYEAPYELISRVVLPDRRTNKRDAYRLKWWIHVEPRPALRSALSRVDHYFLTVRVGKYRQFVWSTPPTLPDSSLFAFAIADSYLFGVLHSRLHEIWALHLGTRLETRPRYTATTCFETFPLPKPDDAQREAIAEAARELDRLRCNWLNPPEWTREQVLEFPGSASGPWARYVHDADARGIGTVRYPRLVPTDEEAAKALKKRTLTNLYNQRPTWLELAHQRLDQAVFAAYGWEPTISDDQLLAKLLELNLARAAAESSGG